MSQRTLVCRRGQFMFSPPNTGVSFPGICFSFFSLATILSTRYSHFLNEMCAILHMTLWRRSVDAIADCDDDDFEDDDCPQSKFVRSYYTTSVNNVRSSTCTSAVLSSRVRNICARSGSRAWMSSYSIHTLHRQHSHY